MSKRTLSPNGYMSSSVLYLDCMVTARGTFELKWGLPIEDIDSHPVLHTLLEYTEVEGEDWKIVNAPVEGTSYSHTGDN